MEKTFGMFLRVCFELSPFFLVVLGIAFIVPYFTKRNVGLIILSVIFLTFGLLLLYAIHIAPQILKVNRVAFPLSSRREASRYRVVLFSDLHIGVLKGRGWVEKVVKIVSKGEPDLILIGGDFVLKADPQKLKSYLEPLRGLKAKEGVYAVLGNHDYGVPGEDVSSELEWALRELGISVLHNQSVELENFTLVGIDEVWAGKADSERAFREVKGDNPVIALCHNPDIFLALENNQGPNHPSADLWLLGHTHNGQVRLPFIGPLFLPTETKMEYGFYDTPFGKAFITQGAGESGLKMRFLTRPEIVILDLLL